MKLDWYVSRLPWLWWKLREIIESPTILVPTENRIMVNQRNFMTTLKEIDSSKEYFIDGKVDMGTLQIVVPVGGITLKGYSFDVSGLISSADNYTMFISESPVIGSGNILGADYYIKVSGTGSKVYEIYDATGFNAFEFIRVNYNDCTSLGDIYDYRQGLETGTGRFGGAPSLTLHGTWFGGYRITTSIVRTLDAGMTEPLFKAGTAFLMNSRFLTDINVDLPANAALLDFTTANFPNPSTLQIHGAEVTRDGVNDSLDSNLTPNITKAALASDWQGNNGLPNTFVGGLKDLSVEVETVIAGVDTPTLLLGTWTDSDLQHFDANFNYAFRHLGINPKDFRNTFDFVVAGAQDEQYMVHLMKDNGGVVTTVYSQLRTIDRLAGSRDVTYFNGTFGITLEQNDFLYWMIENTSTGANCTVEVDSQWFIEER